MKRIRNACLYQTVAFSVRDDMPAAAAERLNREEYEHYKAQLDKKRVAYAVKDERVLPDGTIEIRIRRQYLSHPCDEYLQA